MNDITTDIAIIGAGPAGLAAAVAAQKQGIQNIIVIDRNQWLGGILPQCIHDGFGVEETGKSMTGPEYAQLYIDKAKQNNITFMTETMVLQLTKKHELITINKQGLHQIKAKAIILAMGCREKTRWNIQIPGTRPAGIYTAGVAQTFINLYNLIPGNRVIIIGSGDIGLIMARRLKFEGTEVLGVVEILPYPSGLPRNVVQCLDDYDIPLYLNHTIIEIQGNERVKQITIAQINEKNQPIPGTEQHIQCDTLLLSLGLIPENELSKTANITLDPRTGGAKVNQNLETNHPGIYSCGNCLQVYDTVDELSIDASRAGTHAAKTIHQKPKKQNKRKKITIHPGHNVRYVIPQHITTDGQIRFTLRAIQPAKPSVLTLTGQNGIIASKTLPWVNPANMITANLTISTKIFKSESKLEVHIHEK